MTRKHLATVAAAAALFTFSAAQAAPPVAMAFGNTILSTYPDGRTGELWLHPDGSYDAEGRKGDHSSGHWKTKGEKLCLKQSKPMSSLFSFCTAIPDHGLRDGFDSKAVTGEAIRVTLVHGRAKGHQGPPPS